MSAHSRAFFSFLFLLSSLASYPCSRPLFIVCFVQLYTFSPFFLFLLYPIKVILILNPNVKCLEKFTSSFASQIMTVMENQQRKTQQTVDLIIDHNDIFMHDCPPGDFVNPDDCNPCACLCAPGSSCRPLNSRLHRLFVKKTLHSTVISNNDSVPKSPA